MIPNIHPLYIVVAADQKNGIGIRGTLPWKLKGDMRFFKDITTKTKDPKKRNMVIMGRTTWESLPEKHRPLPGRVNVVLSRNADFSPTGAKRASSLEEAMKLAGSSIETCFIIGGGSVYREGVNFSLLSGIYLTRIQKEYPCDTFFPEIPKKFSHIQSLGKEKEGDTEYEYLLYEKKE